MLRIKKILLVVICLLAAWLSVPKPDLRQGIDFSRCYYDRDGKLLRVTLAGDSSYRIHTPLDKISPLLVEATLLHEDRYYNLHPGANPVALVKAAWNELPGTRRRIGASTISMQLARICYHLNTRTWSGKCVQILRAVQIERHYSKAEILETYLNRASYGRNIEGIGAASLIYYGKTADQLTLAEALTLAVIPQSPARRAPRYANESGKNNRALLEARSRIFTEWIQVHPGDKTLEPTLQMALQVRTPRDLPFLAPHFTDALVRTHNIDRIQTTLDLSLQQVLENEIAHYTEIRRSRGIKNAAALLVDTDTMDVLAAVGSADYFSKDIDGQINGTAMRRPPGSTLKPLLYALAFDEGLIQPHSLLKDAPASFAGYNPENFDRGFAGPIQACAALQQSRNVPAVWLASQLKKNSLYHLLQEAGVAGLHEESHYGLTLALGSAELSMQDLAGLYAMLANHGSLRPLRFSPAEQTAEAKQVLSPEAAFLALDILKHTGRPDRLNAEGLHNNAGAVAWKTGTSWSFRDAWSAAVFDHYVLVVWVGNFSGESNTAFVGRQTAAPLLFGMIDAVRGRSPANPTLAAWENPEGLNLEQVDLCALSGEPAGAHCPKTIKGWFIPGVSPIRTCTVHQAFYVDSKTGRRVDKPSASTRQEVYEVWPGDMLELFRKAGLPRSTPPPLGAEHTVAANDAGNAAPVIVSPRDGITYAVASGGDPATKNVLLSAVAAHDAGNLYWFADSAYLGAGKPGQTLDWKPLPGTHQLVVADDQGRSASRQVVVEAVQ